MVEFKRDLVTRTNREGPAAALRGNSMKAQRESFSAQIKNDFASAVSARHVFFSNRVVPHWNNLPEEVIKSKSVTNFKIALDKFNQIGC